MEYKNRTNFWLYITDSPINCIICLQNIHVYVYMQINDHSDSDPFQQHPKIGSQMVTGIVRIILENGNAQLYTILSYQSFRKTVIGCLH